MNLCSLQWRMLKQINVYNLKSEYTQLKHRLTFVYVIL